MSVTIRPVSKDAIHVRSNPDEEGTEGIAEHPTRLASGTHNVVRPVGKASAGTVVQTALFCLTRQRGRRHPTVGVVLFDSNVSERWGS